MAAVHFDNREPSIKRAYGGYACIPIMNFLCDRYHEDCARSTRTIIIFNIMILPYSGNHKVRGQSKGQNLINFMHVYITIRHAPPWQRKDESFITNNSSIKPYPYNYTYYHYTIL